MELVEESGSSPVGYNATHNAGSSCSGTAAVLAEAISSGDARIPRREQ